MMASGVNARTVSSARCSRVRPFNSRKALSVPMRELLPPARMKAVRLSTRHIIHRLRRPGWSRLEAQAYGVRLHTRFDRQRYGAAAAGCRVREALYYCPERVASEADRI